MIAGMADACKFSMGIIEMPADNKLSLPVDRHVSRATYCRILLPDLLDESIDRCLYLDSDLIVLDDILELSDLDLGDSDLAAVDDYYLIRNRILSIPDTKRYFNAGVVMFNLQMWRSKNLANSVFEYVRDNPENLLYWDQDAMNAVLYQNRKPLPLRWNHQIHFDDCLSHLPDGGKPSEMQAAMANPAIVHFVGPEKPWHYLCLHPYKDLYHKYREKTPWGAIELPNPDMLPRFFAENRIVVFGAGKTGTVTIRQYRQHGCDPEYVLDNDSSKVGSTVKGLPIRSPSCLYEEKHDSMVIVIASMYRDEIKMQLENMGLQEFKHFVVRGSEPKIKPE